TLAQQLDGAFGREPKPFSIV
ncbi:unnamed protein product, partial [Oikopleura dioica]